MKSQKPNHEQVRILAPGWPDSVLLVVVSCLIGIIKFRFHELWKDEWQAWLLATKTSGLGNLFSLLPGEGHPSLWYLLLKCVGLIGTFFQLELAPDWPVQLTHFVIVIGGFFFLFMRFNFPLWMKLGISAGYFMFFEYGVVNRSYALITLFTFAIASMIPEARKKYLLIGLVIFLLCQVEIYGFFIALSFMTYLLSEQEFNIKKLIRQRHLIFMGAALLVGGLCMTLTLLPDVSEQKITFHQKDNFEFVQIAKTLQAISVNTFWIGIIPTIHSAFSFSSFILGLFMTVILSIFFFDSRRVFYSYIFFFIAFYLFSLIIYTGGPRQWGIHLILFIAMLQLYMRQEGFSQLKKWKTGFLVVTFLFQFAHNFKIMQMEINMPFSNSKEAGQFIKSNIPEDKPIIGINKPNCTPVTGYSQRSFYSLPDLTPFSYFNWKDKQYLPGRKDLEEIFTRLNTHEVFIVSPKPINPDLFENLELLKAFSKKNIRDEYYFIYRLIRLD